MLSTILAFIFIIACGVWGWRSGRAEYEKRLARMTEQERLRKRYGCDYGDE